MINVTNKRFFYINSGSQLSETNNTFTAELQIPTDSEYDRIVLMQANIPISYYVIQNGFNTFTLNEGNSSVIITMTAGNYNATSFAIFLVQLLNANSPNGLTYTCTIPNTFNQISTGKFTYTVNTSSYPISFSFGINSTLYEQFGFNYDSTNTFTQGSESSSMISMNVVFFVPESSVFIHSNLVNDEYTDILQEIYSNNSIPFSFLTYLCPDPLAYSKKMSSNKTKSVTFQITDENNRPLFLNGLDIVLTIMIYKDPKIYTQISEFLKFEIQKFNSTNLTE